MTSKSVQEARFIAAPDAKAPSDSETEGPVLTGFYEHKRREATVYDAVAGNVTTTGALPKDSFSPRRSGRRRRRDSGTSGRDPVLAPEEVLFQRRSAPQRYAERDIYFANERDLGPGAGRDVLPDSDLLKAVHAYASDFYEAMAVRSGGGDDNSFFVGSRHVDERSMDETALLAFGILLEEAGREALGRRGDLVFTEGVALLHHNHHHRDGGDVAQGGGHERGMDAGEQQREDEGEDEDEQDYEGRAMRRRRGGSRGAAASLVGGGGGSSSREVSVGLEGDEFWRRRLPKRRKVAEDKDG